MAANTKPDVRVSRPFLGAKAVIYEGISGVKLIIVHYMAAMTNRAAYTTFYTYLSSIPSGMVFRIWVKSIDRQGYLIR
jgi:hypothetical protein